MVTRDTLYLRWPEKIELDEALFFNKLAESNIIVLAENHYNRSIQYAESRIISGVIEALDKKNGFDVGWEFLNSEDQRQIDISFNELSEKRFNPSLFRKLTGLDHPNYNSYDNLLQTIRSKDGRLIGTNLSFHDRSKIVKNGLSVTGQSFDCSPLYKQRFMQRISSDLERDQLTH